MATHIQTVEATADGLATTIAVSITCTAGNFLVCAVKWETNNGPGATPFAGTNGNTWNPLTVKDNPDSNSEPRVHLGYAMNVNSGSETVTYTIAGGGGTFRRIKVSEYSGVLTAGAFDVEANGAVNDASGTATPVTGTFTTAQADELVYTIAAAYASRTWDTSTVDGNAATLRGTTSSVDCVVSERITTSTISGGTADCHHTGAATRWTIATAAFKATAAGPGAGADSLASGMTESSANLIRVTVPEETP